MNIWTKLRKFPPVLIRLMAMRDRRAMSDAEIVAFSDGNLDLSDVKRLSYLTSWDDVSIRDFRSFVMACNADIGDSTLFKTLNQRRRGKRPLNWDHLRKHYQWQDFRQMIEVLAAYLERTK